ncbi:hypothetical protein EON78_04275, partial [bacterium]
MKKTTLTLVSLITLSLVACQSPIVNTDLPDNKISKQNTNIQTFKVSDKVGATISAKIHLGSGFTTKANSNGQPIKKISDIRSLKVYLLKTNTATIAPGSDPLNSSNIVYQNNINVTPSGDLALNFTNIDSSAGNYYHIAVRAFAATNATGTELILDNNGNSTVWTGTTAATPKVAVSNSGIQVRSSDLNVSQTNNLDVNINLQGKMPTVDALIKITDGSPYRIMSYAVNFCTNPAQPDTTKVLANPIIINADSSTMVGNFAHRLELSGLTAANTYYMTVQAYDKEFNSGNSFVRQNNSSTAYTAPDANKLIAQAILSSSQTGDAIELDWQGSDSVAKGFAVCVQ